jgi:hypothetical protein
MPQLKKFILKLALLLTVIVFSTAINADSLSSLLMPGPVTKVHEKYEHDCEQCHDTSGKYEQGELCVQCHDHKNIRHDLSKQTGFHGRLPKSQQTDCKNCHTEHVGRDANIILLNPSSFNHQKTDFPLKGTHKEATCNACHKKGKKHSEAPGDCYSCHKKDDAHKGEQGKKCGDCHKATSWKETAFDHDKTDFPLKGAHKDTTCNACHINKKYKDTPKECLSCHQINDVHRGEFGKKCDDCHNSKKWTNAKFDHKKTDFPLYGRHKKASCNSCHLGGDTKKKLPIKCYGCHKNDDNHKGRYGRKCNDCHVSSSWQKTKFDHDKKTDFPLRGKHKKVACDSCHQGDLYKDELPTKCYSCHKNDDAHKGKQGKKCDSCHNEKGWLYNTIFDHDLVQFPLIGMHAATQCNECHLTPDYEKTETECNACHAADDVHKTQLGTDCHTCHNPNSWHTWLFDHDKATTFKIDGAHKDLGCLDCHRTPSNGKLEASKDCISCHRSDDTHNRQFGGQCGDCHNTKSFKDTHIK